MDELIGVGLLALAAFSVWRLGFWWGIAIFGAAFLLIAFVRGINMASAELGTEQKRRRSRGPALAQVHAAASAFLAGILGFGVAAVVGLATSQGLMGILAAAVTSLVLDTSIGWLLDMDWTGALGSWCFAMLVWLAISVPLAVYVAPGYEAHGVAANAGTALVVFAASWLVWVASPWKHQWVEPRRYPPGESSDG